MSTTDHFEHDVERPREQRADQSRGRAGGRHPVNIGHLVMGVAFLGLTVVWALVVSDTVTIEDNGWILGLPWLVAGAAGLLATVLRRRDPHADPDHDWRHDWKQDQRDWKEKFRADQRAWKEQLRTSHQQMKDELRQHTRSWKHGGPHDRDDHTGPTGH